MTDYGKFIVRLVAVLIVIRLVFALIFTGGLALDSPDLSAAEGIAQAAKQVALREGSCEWYPFIFSGMPSVLIGWYPRTGEPIWMRNYLIGMIGVVLCVIAGFHATDNWWGPIVGCLIGLANIWAGFGMEGFSVAIILFLFHEIPE